MSVVSTTGALDAFTSALDNLAPLAPVKCCACGVAEIDDATAARCPYHPYRGLCADCALQPGEFQQEAV